MYKIEKGNRATQILKDFIINYGSDRIWFLPRNICPIVLHIFKVSEFKIKLIDIEDNGFIDINEIFFKKNIKYGILYVEAYGKNQNTSKLFGRIKKKSDCLIIKDKCLSKPLTEFDYIKDQYSDIVLYSNGYSKYLDLKEGGYAFVKKEYIFKVMNDLKSDKKEFQNRYIDYPFEYEWKNVSKTNFTKYIFETDKLKNKINKKITILLKENNFQYKLLSNTWRYTILSKKYSEIEDFLNKNKIIYGKNYPCVLHSKNKMKNCNACEKSDLLINIFNDFRQKL